MAIDVLSSILVNDEVVNVYCDDNIKEEIVRNPEQVDIT